MEIKVGSKYHSNKKEVKILMIVENEVVVKIKEGNVVAYNIEYFKEIFQPHPQFKWQKNDLVDLSNGDRITYHQYWEDKDFELLHNYKRYHKQCDNVEFEHNDIVWYIDNETVIIDKELCDIGILTPKFSTEEHAKTFLELANENDCLWILQKYESQK